MKNWKQVAVVLLALCLSACGNTRVYFGVDDYGETNQMRNEWTTAGKGARGQQ